MNKFKQPPALEFKACEYGYIVTDGARMCKITAEEKASIDALTEQRFLYAAYARFVELWRD